MTVVYVFDDRGESLAAATLEVLLDAVDPVLSDVIATRRESRP